MFLDARQQPVADAEGGATLRLDDPDARWRLWVIPAVGSGDGAIVPHFDDADDGDARQAAALVQCAARTDFELTGVLHVLEQALERDLVLSVQAEGTGDLALAHRFLLGADEIENRFAAGKTGVGGGLGTGHGTTMGGAAA